MKDEEKNAKKSSKKLIIVIAVIIVIAAIAFGFYSGIFSLPTGLVVGGTSAAGNQKSTNENPASQPSSVQQPIFTTTGTEVMTKDVTENLPYYESLDLESGRYSLQVATDKPVWIRLYDQLHFDEWKNDGNHGKVVIGTNLDEKSKTDNFNKNFDISPGNGGKHYLLIFGNNEKISIKFIIKQIFKT